MADQEQIVLSIDDSSVANAVKRSNAGLESIEQTAQKVTDGLGRSWQRNAETIIRFTDRTKSSIDRTLESLQREAEAYGRSDLERFIARKDRLLEKYAGEERAINGITTAMDQMIERSRQAEAAQAKLVSDEKIAALERQAALYGKTGSTRLIAEQDLLFRQYQGPEHEAVRTAIRQNYGSMIDAAKETEAAAAVEKEKKAVDDLVRSLEREAALAGKSGISRTIAERKLLLEQYKNEPKAVDAITASIKRLEAEEALAQKTHGNIRRLILGAKDFLEGYPRGAIIEGTDYLIGTGGQGGVLSGLFKRGGGAAAGAEGAEAAARIAGVGSAATIAVVGVSALAVAFGGLEIAGLKAMKSLAEYGTELENVHLRTGIAVNEIQDFAFAAKAHGQEVSIFERMMRGLSEAADENSKQGEKARQTLKNLGVDLRDLSTGALKPTGQVMREIAEGLNKLPAGAERDIAALNLFKRAGIETIPVIETLNEKLKESQQIGGEFGEQDLALFKKFRSETDRMKEEWDRFKLHIEEPLAAKILVEIEFFRNVKQKAEEFLGPFASTVRGLEPQMNEVGAPSDSDQIRQSTQAWAQNWVQHTKDVQDRQVADAAVRAFLASQQQDIKTRLQQAEQNLHQLPEPKVGVTTEAELAKYREASQLVEHLKAEDKLLTELEAFHKQARENAGSYLHLATDANGRAIPGNVYRDQQGNLHTPPSPAFIDQRPEVPGYTSIAQAPSELDKRLAAADGLLRRGASWDQVFNQDERNQLTGLLGQAREQGWLPEKEGELPKRLADSFGKAQQEIDKFREQEAKKAAADADEYVRVWLANVQRSMAQIKELDERNFSRMNAAESHQERMTALLAEPGDALKVLQQQLALRAQMRQEELAIKEIHAGLYDLDKERFAAEMANLHDRQEFEEKILELKKQQTEETQHSIEPLVHTLLTRPGEFGKQLGATVREATLKPIEEGISGMLARSITPVLHGPDGQSGIAGALKGLFGGKPNDPQVAAMDLNTMITAANTAAIQAQTAAFEQRQAFQSAQAERAAAASAGLPASATAQPGSLVRELSSSGIETLRYQPRENVNSVVLPGAPTITNADLPLALPPSRQINLGSLLGTSPNGFPVLGQVAASTPQALQGLFGPANSNAFSDLAPQRNLLDLTGSSGPNLPYIQPVDTPPSLLPGPLVSGLAATLNPGPQAPGLRLPVRQQPSLASSLLGGAEKMLLGGGQSSPLVMLGPGGTSGFAGPVNSQYWGGATGDPNAGYTLTRLPSGLILREPASGLITNADLPLALPPQVNLGSLLGTSNSMFGGGGFGSILSNLKGDVFNSGGIPMNLGGTSMTTAGGISQSLGGGFLGNAAGGLAGVASSPLGTMAGGMLAINGLTGNNAGTWKGMFEGAAGGAMLGFKFGGPMGAAIGAAVGFSIGLGEKLAGVESPENEAKRLVKQIYSVSIDTATAQQIVAIAKQKYAGHVSIAVRSPEVRQMVMLYSEATGQKMPQSATTPHGASLVEQGGKLYQAATYQNGTAYTFQSSLPVAGGYATGSYPSPSSVVLNVDGQSAADLLEGRIANTVTPSYVQDQYSQASSSSYGRLNNSAMMQQPGLIVS